MGYLTDLPKQREGAIEHWSMVYALPPELVRAIIQIESSGNPWACRFEPAFLRKYVSEKPRIFGAVSIATERMGRATSWGLCQIMGETARGIGFTGAFFPELCKPETGIEYGCRFLSNLYAKHKDISKTVASYNAGSPRYTETGEFVNQEYVDRVLTAAKMSVAHPKLQTT